MTLESLFDELQVIDTTAAKKYFSLKDYIGKTITIEITELIGEFKGLYKHGYVQEDSSPEAKECVSMRVLVDGNEMLWVSYKHRLAVMCKNAGIQPYKKNTVKVVKDGKSYNFLKVVPPKSEKEVLKEELIALCMNYGNDELGQLIDSTDDDEWYKAVSLVVKAGIWKFGMSVLDWKSDAVVRTLQTYALERIQCKGSEEQIEQAKNKVNATLLGIIKAAA